MIGRNSDVSCATLDHGQNGSQNSTDGADFPPIHILCGGHGIKVPEQFIRPVNQVHVHMAPSIRQCIRLNESACSMSGPGVSLDLRFRGLAVYRRRARTPIANRNVGAPRIPVDSPEEISTEAPVEAAQIESKSGRYIGGDHTTQNRTSLGCAGGY